MNTGIQDAHNLAWKLALATGANRRAGREGGRGGGERAWSIRAERGAREREGASSSGVQRESGERRRFRVSEALVDTYDAERRPTALTCAELAVGNWAEASAVPAAIGLDHKVASGVAGVIGAVPLPRGVRRAALEGLFQIGLGVAGAFGAGMGWSKRRLEELVKSGRTLR